MVGITERKTKKKKKSTKQQQPTTNILKSNRKLGSQFSPISLFVIEYDMRVCSLENLHMFPIKMAFFATSCKLWSSDIRTVGICLVYVDEEYESEMK